MRTDRRMTRAPRAMATRTRSMRADRRMVSAASIFIDRHGGARLPAASPTISASPRAARASSRPRERRGASARRGASRAGPSDSDGGSDPEPGEARPDLIGGAP